MEKSKSKGVPKPRLAGSVRRRVVKYPTATILETIERMSKTDLTRPASLKRSEPRHICP